MRFAKIVFVGFGEVASVICDQARQAGWQGSFVACFADRLPSPSTLERATKRSVPMVPIGEGISAAGLVISVVTPASAASVAEIVARQASSELMFLDLNSIGPQAVARTSDVMRGTPCRFVKGVILGPVPVMRAAVPLAIGGSDAMPIAAWFRDAGFRSVSECRHVLDPARIKMLWSVITKGIIPLYVESLVAAERMGLLDPIVALMRDQLGFFGDRKMILRLLHSSIASGSRRVDEMEEAAAALSEVAVPTRSHGATVAWLKDLVALDGVHRTAFGEKDAEATLERSLEWLSRELKLLGQDA